MIGFLLARWFVHAVVVWASVALVTPRNPSNTIARALLVTFLVALIVTPFAWFWFLIIPAIIAFVCWVVVYTAAYGIGFFQAIAVGIVQAAIGYAVDVLFIRGRLS
jgi:predicted Co/Zn/Cd cation transporter (cation efflux family)